jgi:hypothetical protein
MYDLARRVFSGDSGRIARVERDGVVKRRGIRKMCRCYQM